MLYIQKLISINDLDIFNLRFCLIGPIAGNSFENNGWICVMILDSFDYTSESNQICDNGDGKSKAARIGPGCTCSSLIALEIDDTVPQVRLTSRSAKMVRGTAKLQ